MAKDKSKKDKGGVDNYGGFGKPSDAPAGGDSWKFEAEENIGKLFLITPLREQEQETKNYGVKNVIVADIVELNEKKPEKSEAHDNVFIFGGWTQGAVRGFIGDKRVVGRLDKGEAQTG